MNPWETLPDKPPFIARGDRLTLADPAYDSSDFRFDAFPDPFVGNLDKASVVFLALNPGFEPADIEINLQNPYFIKESRLNLTHQSSVSFFYLMDELKDTFGYKWWRKLLNPIMTDEQIPLEVIRENMMIIEYMPYHSRTYKHNKIVLPSQRYSFDLVRKTIEMQKIIIVMRSKQFWLEAVPELASYDYVQLSNVQTPWISRKNLTPLNPPGAYERVAAALSI
jgi:hypothetical protein